MNSDEYKSQHDVWLKSDRDVMAEMKGNRFYLVPEEFMEKEELGHGQIIVLTDITYWNVHFNDLLNWGRLYNVQFNGLSLTITDPKIVTAFILKWS